MPDPLERLSDNERNRLRPAEHPAWAAPMLAKLTEDRFSDPDWLFERKFDGGRALAFRYGGQIRLLSRNRNELNASYPELVDALCAQPCADLVADGEIVAFEGHLTSFARLQDRMQVADPQAARASGVAVFFYLFDPLHLDGHDLSELPLRRRKALLREAFVFEDPIRFTSHRNGDGEAFLRDACARGWEGLIAKRASAPYRHRRSSQWLKFKCSRGQEGFGALLLGYYDDGRLRYAGKVGTGFGDVFLREMRCRLDRLARGRSPFAGDIHEAAVTFVEPELVAEIGFTEWTRAGRLRHPRFLGLRRDKAAEDVTGERVEN
ncbi:MAG: non-homologous end-joining DNA ligase [Geminicoccaceae bacterium]